MCGEDQSVPVFCLWHYVEKGQQEAYELELRRSGERSNDLFIPLLE